MTQHFVLTLETGVSKQLSSVLAGAENRQFSAVWLQPRGTNAAPVYLGGSATLSSSNFGVRLPAGITGEPPAPFNPGEFAGGPEKFRTPLKLGDFWALGATGDFLHILAIDY